MFALRIRNEILISSLVVILVLSAAGHCFAAKTYEWQDIYKQLEIVNGHKMKDGSLTIRMNIPSNLVESAKKIKFFVGYSGFPSNAYGDSFRLHINDSVFKYRIYSSIKISTKHLKPGINQFVFTDYSGSYHTSDHVIWNLSFSKLIKPKAKDLAVVRELEQKQKIEIAQAVSAEAIDKSPALEWKNIDTAFQIDGGHKLKKGPLMVRVDISAHIIESAEKIKLYIDYSGVPAPHDVTRLNINDSLYNYPVWKRINISTSHLKPGSNVFRFDDPGKGYYGEGLTIEKISFSEIDHSKEDIAKSLVELKKGKKMDSPKKLRKDLIDTSPVLSGPALKRALNTEKNADSIAVVIGNQTYSHTDVPPVNFAVNDAVAVKQFLLDTLGYLDGNIIFETNTTKAHLEKIFGTKDNHRGVLYNYIKPEISDVIIYYSGHGAPDPTTNEAYLVPVDCDPVMMGLTAYPLNAVYGNLPKIEARSITVVIDACFSGGTNTGKWLVSNASPALIKVNNPITTQNNVTILTSAKNNQVSSWYPEKQHGMFTYFFLKAVMGDADSNNDKSITFKEIFSFVGNRAHGVPYYAKRLHGGRIQTPEMQAADPDMVFVTY